MKTVFLCAAVTFDDVPSGRRTCSPNLPPSTVARWQRNPRWTNASDVKRQGFSVFSTPGWRRLVAFRMLGRQSD